VLDVKANGHALLHQTFASGGDVAGYFSDHPIDLGSLSGAYYSGGTLDVVVTLQITANTSGAGVFGGVIITG